MPLLDRTGARVPDGWAYAREPEDLATEGPVFVAPALWRAARESLLERDGPLGLLLAPDDAPEDLAVDLGHFRAIAIEFPRFTDGRGYSHARVLRQRLGFAGEIRAVGEVLRDQLLFMRRCGIDAFLVAKPADADAAPAALREIDVVYQPAADGARPGPRP